MSTRTKRQLGWLVLLVVLTGGGVFAWRAFAGGPEPTRFQTQAASRERIRSTVTASGTISPLKTVEVGSQVSGRILEILVDFNSPVKKGQVIAKIDPSLFESEIAKARANLQVAQANLVKARAGATDARLTEARAAKLAAEGLIPEAEADTADATARSAVAGVTAAQASVAQARAAVEQAESNLSYATIVSPIDGVVISRDVNVGQTVAASMTAPKLFSIAEDMRAMEVHTSVAESDVGSLRPDMAVEFNVDAFPGKRFRGVVTQIRNAAVTVQNVVTYDAVIRVDNDELELRPGMTANVTFIVDERDSALAVPSAALRFTPPGAPAPAAATPARGRRARAVWVLDQGQPRRVEVEVGIGDGRLTEITGGELAEGAAVIVGVEGAGAAATAQRPAANPFNPAGGGGRRGAGGGGRR